ncbi:MAG TPA: ABC transporter ATP-binding protein [Taishania sp.]|nr:ABC transporter ATP-binding protein [Taishania sp.]HNS43241.1 ABC transporter ATP-binding protein [Taishania sp.]
MLVAKNIHKRYDDLEILKGIDLEINKSEVVSIVGSSGAGKTTLLQILGTLDTPNSGTLEINGINPFSLSTKKMAEFRNQHIGFIFQFHQLLPEFTAIENVCIPAMINGKSMSEAKKLALPLLERLGLSHRAEHKPNELSGGEQQRVAVARALVNNPSIIFADEPSGNLDSENSTSLHQLFFDLRNEFQQTFVIVTHNQELAKMADRTITMRDGKISS